MKVTVVGVGSMGGALVRAALKAGRVAPGDLHLIEHRSERAAELSAELGVPVLTDVTADAGCADLFVIAVKPQDAPTVLPHIAQCLRPGAVVVSIMAGITVARISSLLGGTPKLVRAMPNLPVGCNRGVVPYYAAGLEGPGDKAMVENFLSAGAVTFPVADEKLIDSATAISGSGPGFIFYFMEQFLSVASEFGFSPTQAKSLVVSIFGGAAEMWQNSGLQPQELRAQVTSKAGTTAAGIEVLEKQGAAKIIQSMLHRADARCRELNAKMS